MENFAFVRSFEVGGFLLVDKRTSERVSRMWTLAAKDDNLYVASVNVAPMWLKSLFKLRVMAHPINTEVNHVVPTNGPQQACKLQDYLYSHTVCDLPLRIRGSKTAETLKMYVLKHPWANVHVFVSVQSLYNFVQMEAGCHTASEWYGRWMPHWRKRTDTLLCMSPDVHIRRSKEGLSLQVQTMTS
eukprot:2407542-Amphidinium_carterae.4